MKHKTLYALSLSVLLVLAFVLVTIAYAQTYRFAVPKEIVHVYWNSDGTLTVQYELWFENSPAADAIDFVDIGIPTPYYELSAVRALINGVPVASIEKSPYVEHGVALGLGANSIPPGQLGVVNVLIPNVQRVLYVDALDPEYVSAVFSPTWFGSEYVTGYTDLTVTFHLPPGVQPDEPRWHQAPAPFPSEPQTGFDSEGRINYTWRSAQALASVQYKFGASFPRRYIPESAIVAQSVNLDFLISVLSLLLCFAVPVLALVLMVYSAIRAERRKLEYLPPRIAIEGNGIKRGLTAVEAAILMEQPLDKVLTMILFSVIKKGAAKVVSRAPLEITREASASAEKLRPYEEKFLEAFALPDPRKRQEALQAMVIDLVKSVHNKMRGFSRRETVEYYRAIVARAWKQVEEAETPEVKSQKFSEAMEWTMLDRDYEDRTRRVFESGPVYLPTWWPRYDPSFSTSKVYSPSSSPSESAKGPSYVSAPRLPGADFAASIVNGVQNLSTSVIGNLGEFTSRVASKTNPQPLTASSSYSRSGGCACACACACAGCACACAGGGR